jgi:hypothetical protein
VAPGFALAVWSGAALLGGRQNETNKGGAAFISSIGLAFIGGYADASKCGEQLWIDFWQSLFFSVEFS